MSNDEEQPSDSELARQAASGNEGAFSQLFERYYDKMRAFAYRILLDFSAAEDVVQETFIRVARQIQGIRDFQTFEAWIYRICANAARDTLRSNQSHAVKLQNAAKHFEIESSVIASEQASELALALMQGLSPEQREAIALVFLDECSHAEAAKRLGCAESTISWRIHLAKRKLRQLVKK